MSAYVTVVDGRLGRERPHGGSGSDVCPRNRRDRIWLLTGCQVRQSRDGNMSTAFIIPIGHNSGFSCGWRDRALPSCWHGPVILTCLSKFDDLERGGGVAKLYLRADGSEMDPTVCTLPYSA